MELLISIDLPTLGYFLFIAAVSALTGFLIKLCDEISDTKLKLPAGLLLALFYGAIIAYMISYTSLSSLWLATVAAMIVTGKLDKLHIYALGSLVPALIFLPLNSFVLAYFIVFFVAAVIDELEINFLGGRRFVLDLAALGISLISGNWLYFVSIVSFDAAYVLAGYAANKERKLPNDSPRGSAPLVRHRPNPPRIAKSKNTKRA